MKLLNYFADNIASKEIVSDVTIDILLFVHNGPFSLAITSFGIARLINYW